MSNDPTGALAAEPHNTPRLPELPQRVPGATLGQDAVDEARAAREQGGDR